MSRIPAVDSTVQKTHEWLKDIAESLDTPDEKAAFAALRATLHALRDRLPRETAAQLGGQLPMLIRGMYYEGWDPSREPSRARHQAEFFDLVAHGLKDHPQLHNVGRVTRVVFHAMATHLDPGERDKVMAALPQGIRELWPSEAAKLSVAEIMSKNVTWVAPDLSLQEAAKKMRDLDIGCLPVGKDDRLIGMVTDRDIACRAVSQGQDPAKASVGDVMSKGITFCFDDQNVSEAARLMERKRIHRLPVLNRRKRMVGMLSLGDIGLHAAHELTGEVVEAVAKHAA